MGIANAQIWNILKQKGTTSVLTSKHQTGWTRETPAFDDINNCKGCEEKPTNNSQCPYQQSPKGRGDGITNQC